MGDNSQGQLWLHLKAEGVSVPALTGGRLSSRTAETHWMPWDRGLFSPASPRFHPCWTERQAEQPAEEQGKPCPPSDPILGTNAASRGSSGGREHLLMGPHCSGRHSHEEPREKRFKGQTPSSPESCPDSLINVPCLLHLPLFSPKGYSQVSLALTVIFQELRAECFCSNLIKG